MKYVQEIEYEFKLKAQSHLIISAMEDFDQSEDKAFDYPRFQSFRSGLYDEHFTAIFSLIQEPLKTQKAGYHVQNGHAYLVILLPERRYFEATYLIIEGKISYVAVYQDVIIILLVIAILIFILSLFFLNRFAQRFQRVNQRLDRFIKDSMHEINTPLSIINVNIDLYNRSSPTNKYLQRIKAATKTLATIYNDMDYLIKNERIVFEYETINLSLYLRERIDYFQEVAALRKITIEAHIIEGVLVHFNTTQLQRIIDNTISNAIKYSYEDGKIEILLEVDNEQCMMVFKDNGVGIKNSKQIFDRYYRENREKGGFGIGLNIVKSIIEHANIELRIESEEKKGSTFTYIFPPKLLPINNFSYFYIKFTNLG
jgi:signal transduction histidine kinase